MTTKQDQIAAYRRRYEALKASGQAPKTLPGPSPRPAPTKAVFQTETIPGGWYHAAQIERGETVRIQTGTRPASVSFLAWRRDDPSERLNHADTVKVQWTTALRKGRVIFSDMGRVMLSIVEDSGACHDALVGGSTAMSNTRRYGEGFRNTRDNFILAASKLGLEARDIPPCLTFFAPVGTDPDGRFAWHEERRVAGDYIELRAEMDLLVAFSNCPHPLDPASIYDPAPVQVMRLAPMPLAADDLCRTATAEATRGFDNLALLSASGRDQLSREDRYV